MDPGAYRYAKGGLIVICLVGLAGGLLFFGGISRLELVPASHAALRKSAGHAQLVSTEPAGVMEGQICEWQPASATRLLEAAGEQAEALVRASSSAVAGDAQTQTTNELTRVPVRVIRDPYSMFTAVTVDAARNEIVASDENLQHLLIYDRTANTPPNAAMSEPKRMIGAGKDNPKDSVVQYPCGIYVDPKTGDIYQVGQEAERTLSVFSHEANGNVPALRKIRIPITPFGLAVDERHQEVFVTIQHPSVVLVFRKLAKDNEAPVRILEGVHTQLADSHGVAVDPENNLLVVGNYGSVYYGSGKNGELFSVMPTFEEGGVRKWRGWAATTLGSDTAPGSGKFFPPSITIFRLDASGDAAPLRVIQGTKTQLNWPGNISLDPAHGEIFVANDTGNSVLVFRTSDNGDAAPIRVLKGPKTAIKNPTGVYVDTQNDELVVANMASHSITVFPRTAAGDVVPLRIIRSAPLDAAALMLVKPGAVGYDSKREEILVPN